MAPVLFLDECQARLFAASVTQFLVDQIEQLVTLVPAVEEGLTHAFCLFRVGEILNGVEHANFFEARATEYSKGATAGEWHGNDGVWAQFDKRKLVQAE